MSSYFVNSFCGRYPNGADFQLHNYGDHSAAGEQYRDSAAVHAAAAAASGRYGGYGYNGVDLTVGRAGAAGHFVTGERPSCYSPGHSSAASSVEPLRYGQATAGSLSPPPEPLPCSSVASASPAPEPPAQHRALKNSVSSSCSGSGGGALMHARDCVSKASSMEDEKPAGSAPTTPQNVSDSAQPQIYPWMRKLHISHGKVPVFKSLVELRGLKEDRMCECLRLELPRSCRNDVYIIIFLDERGQLTQQNIVPLTEEHMAPDVLLTCSASQSVKTRWRLHH